MLSHLEVGWTHSPTTGELEWRHYPTWKLDRSALSLGSWMDAFPHWGVIWWQRHSPIGELDGGICIAVRGICFIHPQCLLNRMDSCKLEMLS